MRLLDDLGWEPDPSSEQFELTMLPVDLARLFRRLNEEAGTLLKDHFAEARDDAQQQLTTRTAYGDVLAQLASDAHADPSDEHDESSSLPRPGGGLDDSIGRQP